MRSWIRAWLRKRNAKAAAPPARPGSAPGMEEARAAAERCCFEAAQHLAAGRLPEAETALSCALDHRHDHTDALLLQGIVYRKHGRLDAAADSLLLAVHFRPEFAEAHFQLGLIAASQGRSAEAERCYRRAVEGDPRHAKAQNALGAVLVERGSWEEAVEYYRKAVALDPEYAQAHSNLGCLLLTEFDRFDEGAMHIETAWRLAPGDRDVMCNWAMLLQHRGRLADAVALWDQLIDSGAHAQRGRARHNRALALLQQEDFTRGWADYENRFAATGAAVRDFGLARWNGEPLRDKSILVHAEQGVGDEIMFASCLPDLIAVAGRVVIECSDRLEALFRRSFPQAMVHGGKKEDPTDWIARVPPVDYQVPIGSLPRHFRPEHAAFRWAGPYLHADPRRVRDWRARIGAAQGKPVIGLSWRGGTPKTRSHLRSVPLELLASLLRPEIAFVSLQHGAAPSEFQGPVAAIRSFPGMTEDLDELAALICALDLVISVDNTNVQLAGALGRPVWVLVSAGPEWRYGSSRETMPWYPSARLFRQGEDRRWEAVVSRLTRELERLPAPARPGSPPPWCK